MNNIIKRKWNQNSMVIIEDLQGMAFQAESGGHTFQISGIDGEGNAVALSGTPAGVMLRADGQDVALTCSVSGGVVSATLPANAYSVPGRFGLTIFLTSDGQKTAIYAAVGTVGKTSSGTVAPPAGSDVVDLVNAIAAAVATIPASYTDLMAAMAPTYSSSGLYAVGSYAWYNGKLYRCTTAITSGETWTSGHWTPANLGSDLVDLKSAIINEAEIEAEILGVTDHFNLVLNFDQGSMNGSGQETTANNRIRSAIQLYFAPYKMLSFEIESGYKYEIEQFNKDGTLTSSGWKTGHTIVTDTANSTAKYYRFLVAKTDNSAITPSDSTKFTITAYTKIEYAINDLRNQANTHNDILNNLDGKYTGNVVLDFNDFELGNITTSGGIPSYPASITKIRTKQGVSYHLMKNTLVNFDGLSDYYLYYIKYGTTATSGQITTVPFSITETADYGFVISEKNDSEITSISNVIIGLSIVQPITEYVNYDPMLFEEFGIKPGFVVGSISGAGLYTTTNTRCRSELIRVKKGAIISIDYRINYDISAAFLGDDMSVIGSADWNKVIFAPVDSLCCIVGRESNNAQITSTDIENIIATLKVVQNPKNHYWERFPKLHGIAHSGGYFGPRNTIPAYIGAYNHGFKHVETDVAMTKDGVFVCIHGNTINDYARYPDGSELEETLYVYDLTYAELLEYDFGLYNPSWGDQFAGTKIATLEEIAKLCNKLQMHLFVDIKDYPVFTAEQIKQIMNLVNGCGLAGNVTYCCALLDYAEYVYAADNHANISCVFSASQWYRVLRFYSGENAVSLNSTYSTVTDTIIGNCKTYGIPMITGMLDTETELQNVDDYIHGIVSDNLCVEKYWEEQYTEST